jgi:glycerate dehydrogenase
VSNVPNYAQHSVPEHVFMMILALRRNLLKYDAAVRSGRWAASPHFSLLDFPIDVLRGTTLGLIGYGAIAKEVEKLGRAFGMEILIAERKGVVKVRKGRSPFAGVLKHSDVVSVHFPLTPETRGWIGAAELAMMKPEALLINTARGGLVDEAALAKALKSGSLGGAGVDVLSEEPPRNGNPLLDPEIPNLIVTPHVAWASRQAQAMLAEEIVKNMEAFVAGKPRNVVT